MDPSSKSVVFQYATAISAGLSGMAVGIWLTWPSSALGHLTDGSQGFKLTDNQASTLVALMDAGNFMSPIPSGYLMDAIGRKLVLLLTAIIYVFSSVCSLVATNVYYLYSARLLAGIGKGITFSVLPIFLGEMSSPKVRGAVSTMFIGLVNVGIVFEYSMGPFVSYQTLNAINLVVPVLFVATFWYVPESPYYLIMKGREGSARKALAKFRSVPKDETGQGSPLDRELKAMVVSVENDMKNRARFVDMFLTPASRRAVFIVSMLSIFQRMCGISPTLAYSTTIMPKEGGGLPASDYMIIFSFVMFGSNYLATPLIDRMGRKALLILSFVTTGLAMGLNGVYYYLERHPYLDSSSLRWIPYACLIMFGFSYSIGIAFIPATLVGEIFPANIRSHAGALSTILLSITSFLINTLFLRVNKYGIYIMYWIFTGNCVVATLFVVYCMFETKGKTFTEIQNILNNNAHFSDTKE